ncbi:hypothetical protein EDF56_102317 [Novosphingobium sp. PhB165]|nr:hypothetical protein EDF56_102317 [Novosphingobium sp. PhB165]
MFSLLSLYFASRRDVVVAERHMSGLTKQSAPAATATPAAVEVETAAVSENLPLAA